MVNNNDQIHSEWCLKNRQKWNFRLLFRVEGIFLLDFFDYRYWRLIWFFISSILICKGEGQENINAAQRKEECSFYWIFLYSAKLNTVLGDDRYFSIKADSHEKNLHYNLPLMKSLLLLKLNPLPWGHWQPSQQKQNSGVITNPY